MAQHQRDYGVRRAMSCSPNGRPERPPHNHTSLSAVNTPLWPAPSGQLLEHPSSQMGFSPGSLEQHGASNYLTNAGGITQFSDYAGGKSALCFEPGPAVGSTQTETYLGSQQDHMPLAVVVSTDDTNSALEFASAGTYGYSDGLDAPDKLEPEGWENSSVIVETYMDPNRSIAPPFYQPREPVSIRGQNFLSAPHPWRFEPPSSPSAYSLSSTSPISTFSGLDVNSPRITMGDMDESGSSRTYPMQEYQVQEAPSWGASGRVPERVPVSSSPPSWSANQAQSFGCELFQAISPMTPASANTAPIGTPNPLNTTNLPASIIEDSSHMAPILVHPQSFPTEGSGLFTSLVGGSVPIEALGAALQSDHPEFSFSISPSTHGYQPSNVSGPSIMNSPQSKIPAAVGVAGPSFTTHVNASYARAPYGDYTDPISSMGASGSRSADDINAVYALGHAKSKSWSACGSIGKRCGRHRGTSGAKEPEKENNNYLLHMSISALENNGNIQQASSLRDTLRLIIHNCFTNAPTRQEIVDLLFDFLPESVRVRVAESGVKKYYKERIGHILSAPSNKNIFINSAGGRWSLGDGPSQ